MNFLQLVQRVKREAARSGAAPVSIAALSGDDLLLANWVADALVELERREHGWPWMRREISGPTTIGKMAYAAAELDFTRVSFTLGTSAYAAGSTLTQGAASATVRRVILTSGSWSLGTAAGQLIITPVAGVFAGGAALGGGACVLAGAAVSLDSLGRWLAEGRLLGSYRMTAEQTAGQPVVVRFLEWEVFRLRFTLTTHQAGMPQFWSIDPATQALNVGPTPDAAYTLRASYWRSPQALALDADTPGLPVEFHLHLVWRALIELASYDAAPEVLTRAQANLTLVEADLIGLHGPEIEMYPRRGM